MSERAEEAALKFYPDEEFIELFHKEMEEIVMARASCGQSFSWDCPMWCSGKKLENVNYTKNHKVETKCLSCPWYAGNKNTVLEEDNETDSSAYGI